MKRAKKKQKKFLAVRAIKMSLKIPRLDNQLFLTIIALAVIFILILWYDSSSFSFNSYQTICTSNYGKPAELVDCMKPYYNQLTMDRIGIISAGIVIFLTSLTFALQKSKLK